MIPQKVESIDLSRKNRAMNNSDRKKLLSELKQKAIKILSSKSKKYDWSTKARKEQLLPDSDWKTWLILAGRGFGKTRAGAEGVKQLVEMGYKNIGLIAETAQEVRRVMLEGESGLLRIYCEQDRPTYFPSRNLLLWKNGAKAMLFSSESPESLRGPQFDAVWIDELAKFRNAQECWHQVSMCLRLGSPKMIVTTTPKPIKLLKELMLRKDVHITRGSTFDNKANLSADFISNISEAYENTIFGQQELYGEFIDENSSFWTEFQYCSSLPEMEEVIIGIDPAVTSNQKSDETGIIVAGRAGEKYYVLEDLSTKAKVSDWIKMAIEAYYTYSASRIVVEVNQGGDFIRELIREVDPMVELEEVRAISSKKCRAQPVAIMYQQGCVYHTKSFKQLESQMLSFGCDNSNSGSPDRVDALVWCLTKLKKTTKRCIRNIF